MPRRARCIPPNVAHHVTQRGVDRCATFRDDRDRLRYIGLLRDNLEPARVRLLGWCLMTNHVHLVAVPGDEKSLSQLLRRVHGRYAQYFNVCWRRSGHLWQNRFFACPLDTAHLGVALAYVDRNPERAGLVEGAAKYRWSSAAAHLGGGDEFELVDMDWWRREAPSDWARVLHDAAGEEEARLRDCTYAGRPFGDEGFVAGLEQRYGRQWAVRTRRAASAPDVADELQMGLF